MSMPGIGQNSFHAACTDVYVVGPDAFTDSGHTNGGSMTAPSNMLQDDICFVVGCYDTADPATPTGYTSIMGSVGSRMEVFYKVQGASPDTTISGLTTGSDGFYIAFAVRNANTGTPIGQSNSYTASGTGIATDAVTPSNIGDMVITCAGKDDTNVTVWDELGGGYTRIMAYANGTSSATGIAMAIDYILPGTTSVVNPPDYTSADSDTNWTFTWVVQTGYP